MHKFTLLPFGGAVLLDTEVLAISECDEREADLLEQALAGFDIGPDVQRLTARLHEAGWRLAVPSGR